MKKKMPKNYLAEWRDHRGLTQDQLAAAARTSKASISRLESGERHFTQAWMERLAPHLDIEAAAFLKSPINQAAAAGHQVPLIDHIQAGQWRDVADPYPKGEGSTMIPVLRRHGPRAFALKLEGPSMLPEYHDNDIVVIDPDVAPKPGDDVAARVDDDNAATFKRLRIKGYDPKGRPIVELVPLNPDWPVMPLKKGGRIVGPAVELLRRLR